MGDRLTRSPQGTRQKLHQTGSCKHIICTLKAQGRRNYRSSSHKADKSIFFLDLSPLCWAEHLALMIQPSWSQSLTCIHYSYHFRFLVLHCKTTLVLACKPHIDHFELQPHLSGLGTVDSVLRLKNIEIISPNLFQPILQAPVMDRHTEVIGYMLFGLLQKMYWSTVLSTVFHESENRKMVLIQSSLLPSEKMQVILKSYLICFVIHA